MRGPDGQAGGQGWPRRKKRTGGKQAELEACLSRAERDRILGCPHPSPSPGVRQRHRHRQGSMLLVHGGPALPLHSCSSCPSQRGARRPLYRGFIPDPSSSGQPRTRAPCGSERTSEARKWVGEACIVPACCQPQSPTGSRRRVADVREDKGRHGPPPAARHGQPLSARLSWGQRQPFSSILHAPPAPPPTPTSKSFSQNPRLGPGLGAGGELGL